MNKESSFEIIITKIFIIFAIILFTYLFISSLVVTGVNDWDISNELVYIVKDNVLLNIVYLIIFVLVFVLVIKMLTRVNTTKITTYALLITMGLTLIVSICVINSCNTTPQSDSLFVCNSASQINSGDYSSLKYGGYLSMYPHQLGFTTIMRIVFKIFGNSNYRALQYINAVFVPVIIFTGFLITKTISKNNFDALLAYLILMLICSPLYIYTMFVYCEIMQIACAMSSTCILLELFKKISISKLIIYGLLMGLGVFLRNNFYIVVVANIIVIITKIIQKKEYIHLYAILSMTFFIVLGQLTLNICYSKYQQDNTAQIPITAFLIMGLNEDKESPGWHNDYTNNLIIESEGDKEIINKKVNKDFEMLSKRIKDDPIHHLYIVNKKIQCQWNSPMYQAIQMNSYINGEQGKLGYSLFFGKLRNVVEFIANVYQMAMFGCVLLCLLFIEKERGIENLCLLIIVFGTFIFSIFWEAKTRYVFPCLIMMIPYFAIGLSKICKCVLLKTYKRI